MLGRQVERGTAGLKLSVTAKPYSIITMKLNTLIPRSPVCLPCPGPANLANKPLVAPATTQPALGNLQAFFRADTTENIAALEKLKIKDFRSFVQRVSDSFNNTIYSFEVSKICLKYLPMRWENLFYYHPLRWYEKICFLYHPLNLAHLGVTRRLLGSFEKNSVNQNCLIRLSCSLAAVDTRKLGLSSGAAT